ncbi:hypothetical protein [Deinococcus misasensis]|uniref:hypothetical protein n=1 Tax=Deinococcus misasensis TaxID=392413 RepID=UPI0005553F8E|nr:hypothetical protein [Deinococcus misasensis]
MPGPTAPLPLRHIRHHLKQAHGFLEQEEAIVHIETIHHHLQMAHLHLWRMVPAEKRPEGQNWKAWSAVLFHFRLSEARSTVKDLLEQDTLDPQEAAWKLWNLHLTLLPQPARKA